MGSEWPDKRDNNGFSSVARGGGSHCHPPQINSVGSGMVWVMGLFSLCVAISELKWYTRNIQGLSIRFFPTPCLYHELNMIIYTSYINI